MIYTQLIDFECDDTFTCRVAKTIEATQLIKADFEFVTHMEDEKLFTTSWLGLGLTETPITADKRLQRVFCLPPKAGYGTASRTRLANLHSYQVRLLPTNAIDLISRLVGI